MCTVVGMIFFFSVLIRVNWFSPNKESINVHVMCVTCQMMVVDCSNPLGLHVVPVFLFPNYHYTANMTVSVCVIIDCYLLL